jgi:hypothetical protein
MTPNASRMNLPPGYQEATGGVPLLDWAHVERRLPEARQYWLVTVGAEQQPHVVPVWGVWVRQCLHFDGFGTARWARDLARNPSIAVHLESGEDVVILEGKAEDTVPEPSTGTLIVEQWRRKYGRLVPDPARGIYRFSPHIARAWTAFPEDATRWRFDTDR